MLEPSIPFWAVVALLAASGFLIGLSKGGFGGGLGGLVTPMVTLALPDVAAALGVVLPMLMVGDAFALYSYWGEWNGGLVRRLLPGALAGMLLGLFVLVSLPVNWLRLALGVFTLAMLAYKVAGNVLQRWQYQPRFWHAWAAGALSGTASTLFNAGGPPFTSYLLLNGVPPRPFIATGALFFALLNASKVPGFIAARVFNLPLMASLWWGFPFIPLGIWLGRRIIGRINPRAFEAVIITLTLMASGLLIWQAM
jgi:uncharacterized membrane protein YfcA